jgi:hypothetical protein
MITESEIIKTLSESFLGDYPSVLSETDAREAALNLFKQMFNMDVNGSIDSILFYEAVNTNPSALSQIHLTRLDNAISNLENLIDTLPNTVQKLPFIINAETLTTSPIGFTITDEVRTALIQERSRLGEIFRSLANVPTVLSSNFIS